jgi:hypothetical protein
MTSEKTGIHETRTEATQFYSWHTEVIRFKVQFYFCNLPIRPKHYRNFADQGVLVFCTYQVVLYKVVIKMNVAFV